VWELTPFPAPIVKERTDRPAGGGGQSSGGGNASSGLAF
jgi:hypothetical protein